MPNEYLLFLSDNPFRLLSVGSGTLYPELLQKSRTLAHATKVGLAPKPAVAELLGNEELVNCADLVRGLANDPRRLTLFRLFWPLTLPPAEEYSSFEDLGYRADESEEEIPLAEWHRDFVCGWCFYQLERTPISLNEALCEYSAVLPESELPQRLADLLVHEGSTREQATLVVADAVEEQQEWLGSTVLAHALNAARAGRLSGVNEAIELLETYQHFLRFNGLDDQVGEVCSQCANIIIDVALEINERGFQSDPNDDVVPPDPIMCYLRLVPFVEEYSLQSDPIGLCQGIITIYATAVASMFHDAALNYALKGDCAQACELLEPLQQFPLEEEVAERVISDYAQLAALRHLPPDVQAQRVRDAGFDQADRRLGRSQPEPEIPNSEWEEIQPTPTTSRQKSNSASHRSQSTPQQPERTPVKEAPPLFTWNGIGTMLYGETLFFVVLFLPLCPIARYDAFSEDGHTFHFRSHLPLQRWHRIWQALFAAVCVIGILFAMWPQWSSAWENQSLPETTDTSISSMSGEQSETSSGEKALPLATAVEAEDARLDRLRAEKATLTTTLDRLQNEARSTSEALDRESAEIDQRRAVLKTTEAELAKDQAVILADEHRIKADRSHLDRGNRQAVDAYNERVLALKLRYLQLHAREEQARRTEDSFNKQVRQYNARFKAEQKQHQHIDGLAKRLQVVNTALGEPTE